MREMTSTPGAALRRSLPVLLALAVGVAGSLASPRGAAADTAGFVSDDFDSPSLDDSLWSVVDPVGDGEVATVGAGTGDAHLSLSVPAGVSHDAWVVNNSLRVMQAVGDGDVDVEAKFDSTPSERYQMHGLLFAQDGAVFVRFGVHHDGQALRLYGATFDNGGVTTRVNTKLAAESAVHLRVTRSGDSWAFEHSGDGVSWTTAATFEFPMELTAAGPFAGNTASSGASPPAYTALVDYAFDVAAPVDPEDGSGDPEDPPADPDDTPPVISDVAVDPGTTTATVTWATDEPATSAVDFGPTTEYGSSVSDASLTTAHSLALTDLDPDTTYQFSVTSTNEAGLTASSPNAAFTTGQAQSPTGFVSDDFSGSLDDAVWTVVDPVGDGVVSLDQPTSCDSRLALSVPAGVSHDAWVVNNSLRVMQAVGDGDVDVEAKFDSTPSERYQMHGLLFAQDGAVFVRFGVHHDGQALRLYGATFDNGGVTTRVNTKLAAESAVHLRVTRSGDSWAFEHSGDGVSWTTAATFEFPMELTAAGPFAGNTASSGASPPAYTALVDYAFDVAAPIDPEDGGGCEAEAYELTTTVSGAGAIDRSPDAGSYESGTVVTLTAVPESGWLFEGWGGAASGTENPTTVTVTEPLTVSATFVEDTSPPPPPSPPDIEIWYGDEQTVGALGQPQEWANVLGNVSDTDGIASLSYSLNGGPDQPLSVGPDLRRLYGEGDFNVEVGYDELAPGANTVEITAVDGADEVSTAAVTVHRVTGTTWPLPYSTDWSTASAIGERVQVVDGKWALDGGTIRAVENGYDRAVALGDLSWTDYEVTVPVTVHGLAPGYGTSESGGPLVGLGLRWRGHTAVGEEQPRMGFYPTGAFAWHRWDRDGERGAYRLTGNDGSPVGGFNSPTLEFGTTYMFKARVATVSGGAEYRFKVWESGTPEPPTWGTSIVEDAGPEAGGILLLAHHVVADWGDVVVTPIAP
ncbi:MAG: InlB B-repeat-containing protein [Acidimicrobiia bacterium]